MSSIITHGGKALLSPSGKTINFDNLIEQANETTGASDVTLTDAVQTLCDGYGQGGDQAIGQLWTEGIRASYSQPYVVDWSNIPEWTSKTGNDNYGAYMFANVNTNGNGGTWNYLREVYPPSWLHYVGGNTYYCCNSLQYIHDLPKIERIRSNAFYRCLALKSVIFKNLLTNTDYTIDNNAFYQCQSLTSFVLCSDGIVNLRNINAFSGTPIADGTGYIYVPDSLLSEYKATSNWITYKDQIKGLSELDSFNINTSYQWNVLDVTIYHNKIYHCISKESISGILPSGTTADTDYWEYIAEV